MPAYWIARATIVDPVAYKKYTDRVPPIISRYGGRILARGGRYRIMEGPEKFERHVVIEFPTFEQAVACFESPQWSKPRLSAAACFFIPTPAGRRARRSP